MPSCGNSSRGKIVGLDLRGSSRSQSHRPGRRAVGEKEVERLGAEGERDGGELSIRRPKGAEPRSCADSLRRRGIDHEVGPVRERHAPRRPSAGSPAREADGPGTGSVGGGRAARAWAFFDRSSSRVSSWRARLPDSRRPASKTARSWTPARTKRSPSTEPNAPAPRRTTRPIRQTARRSGRAPTTRPDTSSRIGATEVGHSPARAPVCDGQPGRDPFGNRESLRLQRACPCGPGRSRKATPGKRLGSSPMTAPDRKADQNVVPGRP